MNLKEAKIWIRHLQKQMDAIQSRHPNVKFTFSLAVDAKDYMEIYKDYLHLSVDVQYCESEEAHKMCSECNCWKIVKANNLKI